MPISCYAFRLSQKNWGLKSCINDQFTEAGIHSKQRAHINRFSSNSLLETLPWCWGLATITNAEDLRGVENKWRMQRILFSKKGFARSLLIWTITWLHQAHESCFKSGSSLVFSVLCQARQLIHTEHITTFDKGIILYERHCLELEGWPFTLQAVALAGDAWGECGHSFSQLLQSSLSQTLCNHLLLLVQMFVFQLSLDIGFVKGKENIYIYRY